ncbi:hypothetical protein MNBD_DELTA01-1633 [hydrothermal vent metagenome]|uniref:Uncharacterized protein n=1 Tax=hydrothermal vent metagenome TaxID=652676 RepID=A0A3B0QRX3_9ZZZZ
MKQKFLVNTVEIFQSYVYENNRKIVSSSATLTVYRPGGASELISGAAMTVQSDGRLDYSLTVGDNASADENYKAVIAYVYGGTTYYATLYYDVVNSKLHKVVTDDDIVAELPQLRDGGWRVHGTAESGSATTIVDSELKRYEDDYFTGGLAFSIDKDETREIIDFVSSTGTVTAEAFGSAVATDKYILTRSFYREIQRAFEKIEEMLVRRGKRSHLVLDPYDLREVHIYLSVAEVCKGMATEPENLWWELWKGYEKTAIEAFNALNLKYDYTQDGYIAGGEESSSLSYIRSGRR